MSWTPVTAELFPREFPPSPRGPVGRRYSRTLSAGGPMVVSTAVSQLLARWGHFYGHTPVRASVTYLHLLGILVGGGVAVSADRASLGLSPATPDWSQELARLASVHRWVLGGLTLIFASGLLMRAETALRKGVATGWRGFRRASAASLVLWLAILLAGTLLHSTT